MADYKIIFQFQPNHIHRIRNFGEDIWREFREDKWVSISLDEIDIATSTFSVFVRSSKQLRRVEKLVRTRINDHFPDNIYEITVESLESM